jgi:hypothetical protein
MMDISSKLVLRIGDQIKVRPRRNSIARSTPNSTQDQYPDAPPQAATYYRQKAAEARRAAAERVEWSQDGISQHYPTLDG